MAVGCREKLLLLSLSLSLSLSLRTRSNRIRSIESFFLQCVVKEYRDLVIFIFVEEERSIFTFKLLDLIKQKRKIRDALPETFLESLRSHLIFNYDRKFTPSIWH